MGASQSTSDATSEKVFQMETPISFSPGVVHHLADKLEATPERQSVLDSHIRARIQDELEHLKKDEEEVRREIERALEKENLDREKAMSGEACESGGVAGDVRSSSALLGDLEEVRSKIEKYQERRNSSGFPGVDASGDAVVECYRRNHDTPLQCRECVQTFKSAVELLEQQHIKSI